ncbi:S-layer homology domain-containing protein [Paenibacillus sp. A14]|uniref:S-layer homology domain-containing protein n=1 Tax=Paenibacillus sp. A14 TaxID=3119820 RepID=UPI002FE1F84E
MRRFRRQINAVFVFFLLLSQLQPLSGANAAFGEPQAAGYGQLIDTRRAELAPEAVYTWMDIQDDRGRQKIHAVEFNPAHPGLELQAGTKDGKVYGMKPLTEMAAYADKPGNRVVAGINGDFYEISGMATGVPNGLFVDDGIILNSGGSSYAFGLTDEGRSLYGKPVLEKTVAIGGQKTNLTSINRYRSENQLVLFTPDYAGSTKTPATGDEFVLDILEGDVKSGQTLKLKVAEVRLNQGDTPLKEGQVVLSSSGDFRTVTQELKVGEELTAGFALDGAWNEAELIISGQGPLVEEGVVRSGVGPAGVHPRTAIGTKADGSVVLFEVDGRAPGFSEGMETEELAAAMQSMGIVNAMNLDGGGSSTLVARMPGTSDVKMMNRGSDGYERKIGNGLLLVNTAPELSTAASLAVQPNAERILAGASVSFRAAGVDANGHPAPVGEQVFWQADPGLGSIDTNGLFTAGPAAGTGRVQAAAGLAAGSAEIEVVDQLTRLEFPDTIKTYTNGEKVVLSVKALRNGQTIQASNENFVWRVEGNIGTVDEHGVFTATNENGAHGKIYAAYKDVEASFEVNVGLPPVMLEDFENGLGNYTATSVKANSASISEVTDLDYVRGGSRATKLEYDFTGTTGTSGAYLTAASTEQHIQIPGYPEKIGMWVYGDGQKHWLRGQLRDGNKAAIPLDFTDQTTGVDWTGWKYVEAVVPKGKAASLTMDLPVRYMETKNTNKTAGALYIDDIRAIYGPLEEDRTPPVFKQSYPGDNEVVKTGTPNISVTAEDAGYDPLKHPGTTLIDPATIRVYVDDQQVEYGFYPPKGQISYQPKTPLAEGRHKVKVAVRDLSGNQSIKEWYFTVNLGSPFYVYDTPDTLYAGKTYTLDIYAERAAELKEGHVAFKFDPAAVSNLAVVRGGKVSDGQLNSTVDDQGIVKLELHNLHEAKLGDQDLIGQIRYTVRGDYVGPHTLEEAAGQLAKLLKIGFHEGSVTSTKGSGQPVTYLSADVEAAVQAELGLTWNTYEVAKGYEASFTVREANGAAAGGARLLLNGVEVPDAVADAAGVVKTDKVTQNPGTFHIQAVKGDNYSPLMIFKVADHAGSAVPRNINVTMGSDAATSRQFTWHTDPATADTVVEWVKRSEFTDFSAGNVTRIHGGSTLYNTNNDGTLRVHKAEVQGLEPDTEYVYRVGDGEANMSSAGMFRTSGLTGETVKFLFIGDSQAGDKAGFDQWGNTLGKAVEDMPDADLLVHAGDMVDKGFEQEQWDWWFEAARQELMQTTLVPVIGNHEVMGNNGNGDYLAQFHNPQNGPAGTRGSSFSFDINNTHFVVLNTEGSAESFEEQARWLDKDLAGTDRKWKVLFFHQGPYGSIYANERVQKMWVPVFDKHQVDLVLNGHDHIYMRSFPMKNGEIVPVGQGTRYVIGGSSGPKFYSLTERFWQEKIYDEDKHIFTGVEIHGDTITVTAKTLDGTAIDVLTLDKTAPSLQSIEIQGKLQLAPGESDQPVVEGVSSSGARMILNEGIAYTSSEESIASIDADGTITALAEGMTVISATYEGLTDSYNLKVTLDAPTMSGVALRGPKDLKLGETGRAVTEAVYSDGSRFSLPEGVIYNTSNSSVATIDSAGTLRAVGEGISVISAVYQNWSDAYELTVTTGVTPTPNPNPTPDPDRDSDDSDSVDTTPQPVTPPATVQTPGELVIGEKQLLNRGADGAVSVDTKGELRKVVLPGNAAELLKEAPLRIRSEEMQLEIPAAVLGQLAAQRPAGTAAGSSIILSAEPAGDARNWLDSASTRSGATLSAVGAVLTLSMELKDSANRTIASNGALTQPIKVSFPVAAEEDRDLIGIYLTGEDGALQYAGGKWEGDRITAEIHQFGTLAVVKYDKSFSDLSSSHWAERTVKKLAARLLVEGVSADRFEPDRQVTRAEFTAMLVRALGLEDGQTAAPAFADVEAGSWYAEALALASQAGLIQGTGEAEFHPDRAITRQEMAVMLVRAYAKAAGDGAISAASVSPFSDLGGSPAWARTAADQASGLGLMKGREQGQFHPSANGTRAESAQMLLNLIERLEQRPK